MMQIKKEHTPIYLLYIIFGFGGLWHLLNLFQKIMQHMVSPLIIIVTLGLVYGIVRIISSDIQIRFTGWCIFILFTGWAVEYLGIETGFPFGHYAYDDVLQPQIGGVPVSIAFSWLAICLSSFVLSSHLVSQIPLNPARYPIFIPLLTAGLMLLFDIVMEHSAPALGYWSWHTKRIPLRNYLSWFILGLFYSRLWFCLKINIIRFPVFSIHVYISQFLYFVLVLYK